MMGTYEELFFTYFDNAGHAEPLVVDVSIHRRVAHRRRKLRDRITYLKVFN